MLTFRVLSPLKVDFEFSLCVGGFPSGFYRFACGLRVKKVNYMLLDLTNNFRSHFFWTGSVSLHILLNLLMANISTNGFNMFNNIHDK